MGQPEKACLKSSCVMLHRNLKFSVARGCQNWTSISAPAGCSLTESTIKLLVYQAEQLVYCQTPWTLNNLHHCSASAITFQQVISVLEQFFTLVWDIYVAYNSSFTQEDSIYLNYKNEYVHGLCIPSHSHETTVSQATTQMQR